MSAAPLPARDGLAITALVYLFALMTMSTIGALVPFVQRIAVDLHGSGAAVGLAIALFSAPPALLATLTGALMDRIGVRRMLIGAACAGVVGDAIGRSARDVWMLDAALLVDGLGMAAIAIGAPAMLMATLRETTRTRAMAFFATYAPTGFALGLLLAIPFTARGDWRMALGVHMLFAAALAVAGALLLPRVGRAPLEAAGASQVQGGWSRLLRYRPALRLGIAVALPNGIAYGTSLVAPSYLAHADGVSLAASAGAVAAAKIVALVLGGLITGQILASRSPPWRVFAAMAATGLAAQMLFFVPSGNLALAIGGLVLWLFAFGGMSGVAMSLLPMVVPDPARRAVTTGIVNQMISLVSFAAPSTYFAMPGWPGFIVLAAAGLAVSVAMLPVLRLAPEPAR